MYTHAPRKLLYRRDWNRSFFTGKKSIIVKEKHSTSNDKFLEKHFDILVICFCEVAWKREL